MGVPIIFHDWIPLKLLALSTRDDDGQEVLLGGASASGWIFESLFYFIANQPKTIPKTGRYCALDYPGIIIGHVDARLEW
jgi:hypothetical protein